MRRLLGLALLIVGCNGDLSGSDTDGIGGDGSASGGRSGSGGKGSETGGSAGAAPVDELDCRSETQCPALLTAGVEGCAYVDCTHKEKGNCTLVARDADGDGAPEKCRSKHPDIYVFRAPGDRDESKHPWDCNPNDPSIHPNAWDGPVGENHDACDGIDNNCNGKVDDDLDGDASCECQVGATRACALREEDQSEDEVLAAFYRGERTLIGSCRLGHTTCTRQKKWGPCLGARPPRDEVCSALREDRDCNGVEAIDELERVDPSTKVEFHCDYDADGQLPESPIVIYACIEKDGIAVGVKNSCGKWTPVPAEDQTKVDCDDGDPTRGEGMPEYCDGIDSNCNKIPDDLDPDVILPTGGNNVAGYSCDGSRVVLSCALGYGDCDIAAPDGGVASGCETDLRTIEHCGSCTNSCAFSCSGPLSALDCAEIESFSLGRAHTCAKLSDGRVACFGGGTEGQLGNGDALDQIAPVTVLDLGQSVASAALVAAGGAHSCAIVAGEVYCWGSGKYRQNGAAGAVRDRPRPEKLPIEGAVSLGLGLEHSCVVLESGGVKCWGNQLFGRLGMGALVGGNEDPYEDGLNGAHSALVNISGVVDPEYGEIGENDIGAGGASGASSTRPFTSASQVAAGDNHTCVLEDEKVYCAGDNGNFQLGIGEDEDIYQSLYFVEVPGLDNVSQISIHGETTCALRLGRVYCWGSNDMGQVGLPPDQYAVGIPHLIPSLTGVTEIAVGGAFVCARVGGTVFCWGENNRGQLGYPPSELGTESTTPVAIPGLTEATAIGAGALHACALLPTGVHCWGGNTLGQLGRGPRNSDPYPTPVLVTPLGPFSAL